MRRTLVACGAGLGMVAVLLAGLSTVHSLFLSLLVAGIVVRALRRAPRHVRLSFPERGTIVVQARADQPALRGRFDPLYAGGPYCALRIRDPAHGHRVIGLFRDEIPPETWRRLQVALRVA